MQPLAVGENRIGRIIAVVSGVEARRPIDARRERGGADEPRLQGLLDEIETRAAVELAKIEMSSAAA